MSRKMFQKMKNGRLKFISQMDTIDLEERQKWVNKTQKENPLPKEALWVIKKS